MTAFLANAGAGQGGRRLWTVKPLFILLVPLSTNFSSPWICGEEGGLVGGWVGGGWGGGGGRRSEEKLKPAVL